jgi:hypothetical protein
MFCIRESFSQRVYHIQIYVYFANLYIAILDMLTTGVKPALDMLGILVGPWLFSIGYDTIVVTIDNHWIQRTWNHT